MKKILIIVVSATLPFLAGAQEIKPYFSALFVRNVDSSVAWYSKVLKMKVRNRTDAPERGFRQVNLTGDGLLIELIEVDSSLSEERILADQPPKTRIRGFTKFGLVVEDIDKLFAKLKEQHIKFTGRMVTDPVNNKRTFLVNDPDDNLVQFFEK